MFFFGRLTWESMGNYKSCDILGTNRRRAKRTKFRPLGQICGVYRVLLTVKCSSSVWGHSVDFRFFPFSTVRFESFGAFPVFLDLVSTLDLNFHT